MKKISKVQIAFLILAFLLYLSSALGENIVFNVLASLTATRTTKSKIISSLANNNTKSIGKPSEPTNQSAVVQFANGSYGLIKPGNNTFTAGETAIFTPVVVSRDLTYAGVSATYPVVAPNYLLWSFWENLFDLMRNIFDVMRNNIRDEIAFTLFCIACVLEFPKRFKFPKLPPIISRFYGE